VPVEPGPIFARYGAQFPISQGPVTEPRSGIAMAERCGEISGTVCRDSG